MKNNVYLKSLSNNFMINQIFNWNNNYEHVSFHSFPLLLNICHHKSKINHIENIF
jgi:hypothetical protein